MKLNPKTGSLGRLTVGVRSDSTFLGQRVPIEIRDSSLRLVATPTAGLTLDLPAGLYEVGAVLEDGRRHAEVIEVVAGKDTPVELSLLSQGAGATSAGEAAEPVVKASPTPSSMTYQQPRYTRDTASEPDAAAEEALDSVGDARLIEVLGASLTHETRTRWTFECAPRIDSVPTALFQLGTRRTRISLPVSPRRDTPSGLCVVKIERAATGARAQAWITPERKVANALQNMLSAGYLPEAAKVADSALDLLRFKYEDPTGAALGALLLYKASRLHEWEQWVRNLARDFDWLPDGKVLLAQLRYERGDASAEVLDLALRASRQRMLFSDSLSLLVELLRRWPAESGGDARQHALDDVVATTSYVDWESVCLSERLPDGED